MQFSCTFQDMFYFQGLQESPLNSSTFQACLNPDIRQQIVWYFSFPGGGGSGVGEVIRLDISCVSPAADFSFWIPVHRYFGKQR